MAEMYPPDAGLDTGGSALNILSIISSIFSFPFYILFSPLRFSFRVLTALFAPIWNIVAFVLLPVAYTLQGVFYIITFPFRLGLLEKLETIYVYLGIAAIIGCLAGGILYFIFNFIAEAVGIDGRVRDEAMMIEGKEEDDVARGVGRLRGEEGPEGNGSTSMPATPVQVRRRSRPMSSRRKAGRVAKEED